MSKQQILWADDEIDLLKPHILFLQNKGYEVTTVTNGRDALDAMATQNFNLIILDENMPGISGLEALQQIKIQQPNVPVIMITKSEEENIMNQAIGGEIADYLIKPVNPMQILSSIKKNLHSEALVTQKVTIDYQQQFMNISQRINSASTIEDWYDIYSTLVRGELTLSNTETNMDEMLRSADSSMYECKRSVCQVCEAQLRAVDYYRQSSGDEPSGVQVGRRSATE